jgi:hypothetical protein|nr:MAG TPA: Fimbrillin-like [Caudoviricetes sp.]
MMNQSNPFRHLAVAAFACLMAASCSDVTDDSITLPDGKYPMTFTASVDGLSVPTPASRATTDVNGQTSWQENDPVAISMDGGANHKVYKISDAGTGAMLPDGEANTLYWQKSDETKTLAAWHPVSCTIGSNTGSGEVSITDQRSGFGTLENILHAPARDYAYSNGGSVAFTFRHALAKVKVALKKGDGIEESDLSNAIVTFTGYTAGTLGYGGMTDSEGMTGSKGSNGDISPKAETPAGGGAATYTALVIPQQMQGKKFIKVTIGTGSAARDYYYTPTNSTDADLEAGKQYNYTITVKKTGLVVTVTGNGTAWMDTSIDTNPDAAVTYHITAPEGVTIKAASGGTLTNNGDGSYTLLGGNAVTIIGARIGIKGLYEVADGTTYTLKSDLLIKYSLADARVGDFYCKNSSGEGYLIPGDIAQLTEERQAACIGIVYSTDVNRIGKAAKEVLTDKGITPHGLVMALTNASNSCNWGKVRNDENSNGSEGEPFKENTDKVYKMYKNVDGYGETHWIIDTYGRDGNTALQNTYTAFYHTSRYGTAESNTGKYAAPSNTTGWFIPSMGQWWDILSNLGKIDLTSYRNSADSYADIGHTVPTAVDNINTYLQKISDATPFSTNTYFCSSSEHDDFSACNVLFHSNGDLGLHYSGKDRSDRRLRCSFAF